MTHNTQSASSELSEAKERTIASFAHFGGILGFLPSAAIYLKYRGRGTGFAEQEAREAMDFTLVPSIVILVFMVASLIPNIGNVALPAAALAWIFMAIGAMLGGSKASKGYAYTYRFTPRLLEKSYFDKNQNPDTFTIDALLPGRLCSG